MAGLTKRMRIAERIGLDQEYGFSEIHTILILLALFALLIVIVGVAITFGAAMGIVFSDYLLSIQLSAFIFGSLAVAMAYFLARVRKETPIVTLILAGVIIGSIFSAMVSILKYLATDAALREIVFWLMGGFYYATWNDVHLLALIIIPSFLIMWALGWKLNILSMGDDEARALGVNPEKYKFVLITLATLVTSLAVSTVGIITSILGAPYLFYLLRTRGKAMLG